MTTTTRAAKRTKCKSCGGEILWALGPDGTKWMPVDYVETLGGNLRVYLEVHTKRLRWKHEIPDAVKFAHRAHWRTCPNADAHRKNAGEARPERPAREQLDMFGGGAAPRPLHADDGGTKR